MAHIYIVVFTYLAKVNSVCSYMYKGYIVTTVSGQNTVIAPFSVRVGHMVTSDGHVRWSQVTESESY